MTFALKFRIKSLSAAFVLFALWATPAMAQHTVALSWAASATSGATYNVYRQQACSGNFAKLNASAVTANSYTDSAVAGGETYCYQVTAVSGGLESAPTSSASATIPAALAAPATPQPANKNSCSRRGTFSAWAKCVAALPRKGN